MTEMKHWPAPDAIELTLNLPVAGVPLGLDSTGMLVALPAVRPEPVKIGLLGAPAPARLIAYRLAQASVHLTVISRRPQVWQPLQSAVPPQWLNVTDDAPAAQPATPPGTAPGPWAFVADLPQPPPNWLGDGPWTTVLAVAEQIPARSDFWQSVEAVVVAGSGHGGVLAKLLHPDAIKVDKLPPGYLALVTPWRATLFRFVLSDVERSIIR